MNIQMAQPALHAADRKHAPARLALRQCDTLQLGRQRRTETDIGEPRADFFGATYGSDKDYNDYGYGGQVQRQFAITRGFNDSRFNSPLNSNNSGRTVTNLRESLFDRFLRTWTSPSRRESLSNSASSRSHASAAMCRVDAFRFPPRC